MSANNLILIKWRKPSYFVSDCDADTGSGSPIGNAKTLEKAVRIANKYMDQGNEIEYGIHIKLKLIKK